jgi:diguanylate cyclase (GGDEF)-like protein
MLNRFVVSILIMNVLTTSLRPPLDRRFLAMIVGYTATALAIGTLLGSRGFGEPLVLLAAGLCAVSAACFFFSQRLRPIDRSLCQSRDDDEADARANNDPLTGLMTRVAFNRALDRMGHAHDGGDVGVLFFDLNRFRDVNDGLGHKTGDLVLAEVGARLRLILAPATALARMGGDEFAAVVPVAGHARPDALAIAVGEALRQPFTIDGHMVLIGTSIGIAYGNLAYDQGQILLKRAELAMYEAKAAKLTTFRTFDDSMEDRVSEKTSVRAELGKAMISDELLLNYQPIVASRTGELKSVEALLRWKSARLGDVSPGVLVPIAEESGQIIELSDWVIDQALRTIKTLGNVPVGVNISPLHFRHRNFATLIADKLLAADVRPEMLYIEITEGVLISHMESARRTIAELRNLGIRVYLDDFGTGYSSLSYLQNFELDGMKIDKSFLNDLGQRPQATQIMRSVIDLGHSLNLSVVAEGVENDWQARLLQLLNCDLLQGFYFAPPMTLESLKDYRGSHDTAVAHLTPERPHLVRG